jgi:preprotein translocase subunit SecA
MFEMYFDSSLWTDRLRRLFGDTTVRDLRPYRDRVQKIRDLSDSFAGVEDGTLGELSANLKQRVRDGIPVDEVIEEVFALVSEAAWRALGLRLFDEQIIAGLAMHEGRVVEMQTGEGKTLAAVAPVALNSLTGDGAHVLTFNDYLARRDAAWMGPVYRLLGLEVGHVQEGMSSAERRQAYAADITYLTAKEAGFDHLRDLLCLEPADLVQRPFHFALVDEADSILIDEARIPLVIAGDVDDAPTTAGRIAKLARQLMPMMDFDTDEHSHNLFLTERGSRRVEQIAGCGNLYDQCNLELLTDLRNALHAEHLLTRDVDYIVRKGKVELVDDFTGRVADRRQWPDGLQAAIEAKESVQLQSEGLILGSMTMQDFVGSYPKLAGMTATARPSAEELGDFYNLQVVVIPTHLPCRRVDHEDLVFTDQEAKRNALENEIGSVHATGRPILVGTASVHESEALASELVRAGIPVQVLNAKNDEIEAEIIAGAGALGSVTISTNMAGRGTDIKLGGPDESQRDRVAALGGLYLIGTNRHESRRVDDQLRGRAGRQGDPGSTRFFVSLEDPLIERYGVRNLVSHRHLPEKQPDPVDDPVLHREIARAQRIIEGSSFDIRKRLWKYSSLLEGQRQTLQRWRQEILVDRHRPELLASHCCDRWSTIAETVEPGVLHHVEKRLTLLTIDRCWSDHLALIRRIRDGIHVVSFVGKDPLTEFTREVGEAFAELRRTIEDEVITTFERVTVTNDGVDWEMEGLLGPSSTWTYLVSDDPFGHSSMRGLANSAGVAAGASAFAAPFLFLWSLILHHKRRRLRKSIDQRDRAA